ncbi:unnamed protein product [Urochloa decumbens]|uniref:Uncharacterized protein n=1 Tax=Urochloa decumbens TaxID=240449 RepID=A0ABC9GBI1_9POAL
MLLLRRHLPALFRAAPSPIHHRACPLLSTSAPASPFSLEDYLVASCGLAPTQATETAQKAFDEISKDKKKAFEDLSWSRLNSTSNPDAVLALLSGVGLSRADIAAVVVADPLLLRSSPKNIGSRLLALRDRLGLSAPQVVSFLLQCPRSVRKGDIVPRVEFFISFYGSFEKFLVASKKSRTMGRCILQCDLERVVKPNIEFLRDCGLSVRHIAKLNARLLVLNSERIKEFVLRAQGLGVPCSSVMFWQALRIVTQHTKEKVAARLEFLKTALGFHESQVATAVSKTPSILGMSEECLHRKIQFLIKEVGLEPQYIVERPILLTFCLEKRLVPRHRVMKLLQAKGLLNSNVGFFTFAKTGEETFKWRYIDCHKDSVPSLADAYATACGGVVPSTA